MKISSKEANKLLKKLNEDYQLLSDEENENSIFVASINENIEDCRPNYNYDDTTKKMKEIESKIRKVKHAINVFNTTTKVEGFDMFIDEVLVMMPQLTKKKDKLAKMRKYKNRWRAQSRYGDYSTERVDYMYANFDIEKVKKEYDEVVVTLNKVQIALDKANSKGLIDIDLE